MAGEVQKIFRAYLDVTKPGIILGNAMTASAGFAVAGGGSLQTFVWMLCGLSLVIAAGCVLNNYIDRNADIQMVRTRNRPLVKKLISPMQALTYAAGLSIGGAMMLAFGTNLLATWIALFGFIAYVIVYTYVKYWTVHATFIGSFAGAVPPAVGYCAVRGEFDLGALLITLFVMAWQMPHFFAISIFRMHEYEKAGIPVHPLVKGILATKIQMVIYIFAFALIGVMMRFFSIAGPIFTYSTLALSAYWLVVCIQGFTSEKDVKWARKMFGISLLVIVVASVALVVERI